MVTLKEIAVACNLSPTAVSKALRGEKDISEKTIKKVQRIADEMGYLPNYAAVKLRTNRSYSIGVILHDNKSAGVTHEFFAEILNSLMQRARQSGYAIKFITDKLGQKDVSYVECINALGCDGVVILADAFEDAKVREVSAINMPVVVVDYLYNDCSAILSDNKVGMYEMVKYAHRMGHRNIAFVHGEMTVVTKQRLASFHRACEELGLHIPDDYLVQGVFHDPASAEEQTYKLLKLKKPPTFIFYQDDFAFFGAKNAFNKLGITYPEDISVAGYNGNLISQVMQPALMTWKQNTQEMGTKAFDILLQGIEKPKSFQSQTIEVRGEFLKGKSVKDLNQEEE